MNWPLFRIFTTFIVVTLSAGYFIDKAVFFGVIDPVGAALTISSMCLLFWQAVTYEDEPHEIQDR